MSENKFSINDKVVYPGHGIGTVNKTLERNFLGKPTNYYEIYISSSEMTVLIPVDKVDELGVRTIVTADEANKAMEILSQKSEPLTTDWKLRYQMNLDLFKKGSIEDVARIVQSLYNRSRIKELPVQERKLYDNARELLIDEVSLATGESKDKVEDEIQKLLEPQGEQLSVKKPTMLDDEDDDLMDDMGDMDLKDDDADNADDDEEDDDDEDEDKDDDDSPDAQESDDDFDDGEDEDFD